MSEEHHSKVCEPKNEQLPNRWNSSWPHISLAHETQELHERKSAKKADEIVIRDRRLKFSRLLECFVGQDNCDAHHCCCAFGRKRDTIASSTITTNANAPQKCIESIWLAFGQPRTVSEKGLLPHPQPRCRVPPSEVQRPRESDRNAERLH
jgi:hypothetical protein